MEKLDPREPFTEGLVCPRCGSDAYGEEADGTMTCMTCKLGIQTTDDNKEYRAGYDYACGYQD